MIVQDVHVFRHDGLKVTLQMLWLSQIKCYGKGNGMSGMANVIRGVFGQSRRMDCVGSVLKHKKVF